jgi:uncharacterized membrane protein YcaP (DUF421 family)
MDQLILVTWKSVLIFIILVGLARFIGRKLLAQMSYFDFTVTITIGTIAGSYVVQMVEGMWVLIAPILLAVLAIGFDILHMKSIRLRKLTEGEPVILMQNGNIMNKNMNNLRYHIGNLEAQLRDKGIFDFNEVEYAILEPHGQLSVLKKAQHQPVTPTVMNITVPNKGISVEIIKDGLVLEQNLHQLNLPYKWLTDELIKRNVNEGDVFYAAVNTNKELYVSLKDSCITRPQRVEDF